MVLEGFCEPTQNESKRTNNNLVSTEERQHNGEVNLMTPPAPVHLGLGEIIFILG